MRELSLNILDVVSNSVKAKAKNISILIEIYTKKDFMKIEIKDDGCGMSEDMVKKVSDPFVTTRKTRKVGLGIPLFKMSALACEGTFDIQSKVGVGTIVTATYKYSHIDRMPIGDISLTMDTLIRMNIDIEYEYKFVFDDKSFIFATKEIKKILQGVPLDNQEVLTYIKEYIKDSQRNICGGNI